MIIEIALGIVLAMLLLSLLPLLFVGAVYLLRAVFFIAVIALLCYWAITQTAAFFTIAALILAPLALEAIPWKKIRLSRRRT